MKIEVKRKHATKARKVINLFTGEEMMIKAKPTCRAVKIQPLKKLKEMAEWDKGENIKAGLAQPFFILESKNNIP